MDNKEKKVLEEAELLYPTPNCVEYYQTVKATADEVVQRIFEAMSDYVPVVRCKDCKHGSPNGKYGCKCYHYKLYETHEMSPNDFCSRGERREDEDE